MKIINKILVLLLIASFSCVNRPSPGSGSNFEVSPTIKNESYYKSKGYQVFSDFGFAVKCPVVLKDVSRISNDDFDFNYGGFLNEKSKEKLVFYQITIVKFPVGYKDMPYEEVQKKFMEFINTNAKGEPVRWGEEEYPASVHDYVHNGYSGRGISVLVEGKVYGFNVITNDDLNAKFNSFTNNVVFFTQNSTASNSSVPSSVKSISGNSSNPQPQNAQTQTPANSADNAIPLPNGVTYTNRQKRFSIDYPNGWEKQENQYQNVQFVAFLEPENGDKFRTNFNVIVSNRSESAERLFEMTQQQNRRQFPGYRLNEKEVVAINGTNGIKQVASYDLNGYAVKGIQYILKRSDNTLYSITFTVWEPHYDKDKNLLDSIIQSFKPL